MKLWMKYLLGIILGVVSVFIVPFDSPMAKEILSFLTTIFTRIGRYALLPSMFFGVGIAVYKLRDGGLTTISAFWILITIIASSALLSALGLFSALLIKLPPLPISAEKTFDEVSISVKDMILRVFPDSPFSTLLQGTFLLPCFVFGAFIGGACTTNKTESKSAITVIESFSNVSYSMLSFFADMMTIGMIVLSCRWAIEFSAAWKVGAYLPLFSLIALDIILVSLVIYPIILRFVCHDPRPFKVLYASLCPFLTGFFTGDTNLTMLLSIRHGSESLGIRRRTNAVTFPIFSIFARGGSAMMTSICFVVILRTYSTLAISFSDAMWILLISFALSFALGGFATGGPFIALTIMCTMYGRGFASGYLLLRTASPIICAASCALDAITAMFGSYLIAVKTRTIDHRALKQFI